MVEAVAEVGLELVYLLLCVELDEAYVADQVHGLDELAAGPHWVVQVYVDMKVNVVVTEDAAAVTEFAVVDTLEDVEEDISEVEAVLEAEPQIPAYPAGIFST